MYGDIDPIVPIDQGLNYFRAARKGQVDTKYTLMPISPHMYRQPYATAARQWIQQRWPVSAKGTRLKPGRLKLKRG